MSSKMIDNLELGRYTQTFGQGKPPAMEVIETETGTSYVFSREGLDDDGMRTLTDEEQKIFNETPLGKSKAKRLPKGVKFGEK